MRRSIVREHHFERDLRALFGEDAEDADEFTEAAEWLLSADPEAGLRSAPDSVIWALPMFPLCGRTVALLYTFDAERVFFIGLELFD